MNICPPTTSVGNSLQCINSLSTINGIPLFSVTILTLLWISMFWRMKSTEGTKNAILTANLVVMMVAVLLEFISVLSTNGIGGLMNDGLLGILIVLTFISLIPVINRN